jgi:hypothetical protein
MWPLFYGMIAIISANIIFCQRKHGRKYFREYPYNGEDDLEALFINPPLPVPRSKVLLAPICM